MGDALWYPLWDASHVATTASEVAKIIGDRGRGRDRDRGRDRGRAASGAGAAAGPVGAPQPQEQEQGQEERGRASSASLLAAPAAPPSSPGPGAGPGPPAPQLPPPQSHSQWPSPSLFAVASSPGSLLRSTPGSSSAAPSERELLLVEQVHALRQEVACLRQEAAVLRTARAWGILLDASKASKAKSPEAAAALLTVLDELGVETAGDLGTLSREQAQACAAHLKPVQATQFFQSLFLP